MAKYIQRGETIDYTAAADLDLGDVVDLGGCVGIAAVPMESGELGTLALTGVWEMDKASGAITVGAKVYLDGSGDVTTSATRGESPSVTNNTPAGIAVTAAQSADTTVWVKIG